MGASQAQDGQTIISNKKSQPSDVSISSEGSHTFGLDDRSEGNTRQFKAYWEY